MKIYMGFEINEDGATEWRNNDGKIERRALYADNGWESVANLDDTPKTPEELKDDCEKGGFGYEPPKTMENQIEFDHPLDLIERNYPGQYPEQSPIWLSLDFKNEIITAYDQDYKVSGTPFDIWHGHRYTIALPNNVDASLLKEWVDEEILPIANWILNEYEEHWDGSNYVARFSREAQEKLESMDYEAQCGDIGAPCLDASQGWQDACDYLQNVINIKPGYVEIEGPWGEGQSIDDRFMIDADTDDSYIEKMAEIIEKEALADYVKVDDCEEYLRGLRDDLENIEGAIEEAIKAATENNPGLEEMDNPYERIAEYLPESAGYNDLIPEKIGEDSIAYAERVQGLVDTIWANI